MDEYIERDAVISDLEAAEKHGGMGMIIANTLKQYVKRVPTADVVEVVHAKWVNLHWIGSTSASNCSACNFEAQHREYRGVEEFYKYCPGCGAKMDLEESK